MAIIISYVEVFLFLLDMPCIDSLGIFVILTQLSAQYLLFIPINAYLYILISSLVLIIHASILLFNYTNYYYNALDYIIAFRIGITYQIIYTLISIYCTSSITLCIITFITSIISCCINILNYIIYGLAFILSCRSLNIYNLVEVKSILLSTYISMFIGTKLPPHLAILYGIYSTFTLCIIITSSYYRYLCLLFIISFGFILSKVIYVGISSIYLFIIFFNSLLICVNFII